MPKYRVRPGRSHSGFIMVDGKRVRHKFGSGEVVDLTEASAMAFADRFDLVEGSGKRSANMAEAPAAPVNPEVPEGPAASTRPKKRTRRKGKGKKKASAKAAG